jgi:hypothetical protein
MGCAYPLKFSKLINSKCSGISFRVMFSAERDHPSWIMVLLQVPRGIKMVPCEVWASAVRNRATKSHFLPQLPNHFDGWVSIHLFMSEWVSLNDGEGCAGKWFRKQRLPTPFLPLGG